MSVQEHRSGAYRDDRMFVMRITHGSTRSIGGMEEIITGPDHAAGSNSTILVTYRNVPSLPPVRSDEFDTLEKAIQYVKEIEPTCPRVSLNGNSPRPTPSWQEHLDWLHELGLQSAAEGYQPRPTWAIKEGSFPT